MADGCVTDTDDARALPCNGASPSGITELVAAMREQWDGLDGDERAFVVYRVRQLQHMSGRTDETDAGGA